MNKIQLRESISLLANVGVVVGIFFLILEINQNTDALYAESRQATLTASQAELYKLLDNPDLELMVLRDEPLSKEDQLRLATWLSALMRVREFSWLQYRDGIMDEDQWSTERQIIQWILSAPRTREWWENTSSYNFGENFRKFVDNEITDQPATGEAWRAEMNWASR